jgi:hypothetical protein
MDEKVKEKHKLISDTSCETVDSLALIPRRSQEVCEMK